MATSPRAARARWINLALVLLAFGLLAWAVRGNWDKLQDVARRRPDPRLLAAGFAIYMTALTVTFVRWFWLVRALGLPFRVADALRLGFIGNVFNLVIPGAVGGDVIKAAYLCREQARKTLAVSSMVIDRAVGLLGLFVLGGAAGAPAWPDAPRGVRGLIVAAWALSACGVLGLAILFTPALYRPLERLVAGRGRLETLVAELVAMASAYRERLGVVAAALGVSILGHALFVAAFYCVSRALFPTEAPSIGQHYVIVPLILFSTAVPLPFGALGLTEKVSEQLFALVHYDGGAVAMMGYRGLLYAGGLVSALVYLANIRQVRSLTREAEATS